MDALWHWLGYWTGVTNEAGKGYAWWSGIGSCMGYLSSWTALAVVYHRFNCHVDPCRRIGVHHVEGTAFTVCKRHHPTIPDGKVSVHHVHHAFHTHRKATIHDS